MKRDLVKRINQYNEGRNADLLRLKYEDMCKNNFKFYRGTAHLFYEDVKPNSFLYNSPKAWICGDLHFENFGSYKGDNGLVYFDINDFDEAILGPCLFDISRFLISLVLIAELGGFTLSEAMKMCETFLDTYIQTLSTGNSRWVEKETASGVVKRLLEKVDKRKSLVKRYVKAGKETKQLNFKHKKLVRPSVEEKKHITEIIQNWHISSKAKKFYNVVDIGYHIKGTGSLGIKRYILLVQKKWDEQYALVDLKMATPSCLAASVQEIPQPVWQNEAERTVEIQKRVQGTYQALLESIETKDSSFVLREYQAQEDKVKFKLCKGDINRVKEVVTIMAQVTAWGQLQSGGRQGSSTTDDLIAFAQNNVEWREKVMAFTSSYIQQSKEDYEEFVREFPA